MKLCVLGSGSKGNSFYFECGSTKILVDVGFSAKRIVERLGHIGVSPGEISGICITHEHGDHVRGLVKFSFDHQIPAYLTRKTFSKIKNKEKLEPTARLFESGSHFAIENISVLPFPILHDAADPHGYIIKNQTKQVAVATDIGYITQLVRYRLQNMDWLVLESNYDEAMLKAGPYPWQLKQRVMSKHGHLSNVDATAAIKDAHHEGLKGVSLAHISETNNCEEIALDTISKRLKYWEIDRLKIQMTYQQRIAPMIELS